MPTRASAGQETSVSVEYQHTANACEKKKMSSRIKGERVRIGDVESEREREREREEGRERESKREEDRREELERERERDRAKIETEMLSFIFKTRASRTQASPTHAAEWR
jgi:hypothetical protein